MTIHDKINDEIYVLDIGKITAREALKIAKEFGYNSEYGGDSDTQLFFDGKKYYVRYP